MWCHFLALVWHLGSCFPEKSGNVSSLIVHWEEEWSVDCSLRYSLHRLVAYPEKCVRSRGKHQRAHTTRECRSVSPPALQGAQGYSICLACVRPWVQWFPNTTTHTHRQRDREGGTGCSWCHTAYCFTGNFRWGWWEGSAVVWTQGLALPRQVFYHISHSISPFLFGVFSG
jgi:hypothetical protein